MYQCKCIVRRIERKLRDGCFLVVSVAATVVIYLSAQGNLSFSHEFNFLRENTPSVVSFFPLSRWWPIMVAELDESGVDLSRPIICLLYLPEEPLFGLAALWIDLNAWGAKRLDERRRAFILEHKLLGYTVVVACDSVAVVCFVVVFYTILFLFSLAFLISAFCSLRVLRAFGRWRKE